MASPSPQSVAASTNKNLFQCGTCSQSFTRIDHLGRHVRSHTQEKPYRCSVCNKRFGRVDLLSRHSALHNPRRDTTALKRRNGVNVASSRASKACEACAVDHLRCDDEKPCRRCQRRAIPCTLPGSPVRQIAQAPIAVPGDDGPVETNGPQDAELQVIVDAQQPLDQQDASASSIQPPPDTCMLLPDVDESLQYEYPVSRGELVNFGLEMSLDLSVLDLSFLDSYNTRAPFEYEAATVSTTEPLLDATEGGATETEQAAKEDRSTQRIRWRFVPVARDNGYAEHGNLLLSGQNGHDDTPQSLLNVQPCPDSDDGDYVTLASRDKILSIVLSQMPKPFLFNAASFPSPELLDRLARYHLSVRFASPNEWIHKAMAAAGALLTPDPALRKLGYAMQEVLRHQLPAVYESDNTLIKDLELQQAFLIDLEIGLWSGNSRKMELCESRRHTLITIIRRRGLFDAARYPRISVHPNDSGQSLESKWKLWVRAESKKRLVYRLWKHDTQCSTVLLTGPLISYAELSLPLPCCPRLWNALNAEQWRDIFCLHESEAQPSFRTRSLMECIMNMDLLDSHRATIDMNLSCTAVLQALWGLSWEYRQMSLLTSTASTCTPPRSWSAGLLMGSRYQQLTEMLNYFKVAYGNETSLYWNSTLMHLHMSLEEVQLLATGLEQLDTLGKIPPTIAAWSASKDGRTAVWHAAQIVREARGSRPQCLRDFAAVALYQATLALWAYGMAIGSLANISTAQESIWIDSEETEHIQRFISLGRGRPALHGWSPQGGFVDLWDPTAVLTMAIQLMHYNHSGSDACEPPLVECLIHALQKLLEVTT
ncbi:C6 transcription factor RegA [Aspergillus terreus]|uniref:C6 transcription factor RegA n=1 Tax=Aspergillus terreus TaxID=33178 RepID=A0A5M3Z8Y3_ASPTE|nr:hypothetical protein ATETN484_0011057900 [Aspergillus terreus]GFF19221.1 C6 transcription factor RegA [Aspergillus terreus]